MKRACHTTDTIVAPATPRGRSAIAVVRLTGPDSHRLLGRHWQGKGVRDGDLPAARTMHMGIFKSSAMSDSVVVCRYTTPASYTGEDMVELYCHGNPVIVDEIIRTFQESGARLAGPGEFTRRAFENGKLDLIQAESVAQVIAAENEETLQRLGQQYAGQFSQTVSAMRQEILELSAWIEADLDFGDREVDDVAPINKKDAGSILTRLREQSRGLLDSVARSRPLQEGFRAVLVGKPNVGKSSLFNRLSGDERALVDETPGTTRDYLEAVLSVDGMRLRLTDTAGLHAAVEGLEARGVERSREQISRADIVLALFDRSTCLTSDDEAVLQLLRPLACPVVLISNKIDQKPAWDDADLQRRTKEMGLALVGHVEVSALSGAGIDRLHAQLRETLQRENAKVGSVVLTARQSEILHTVDAAIGRALSTLDQKRGEECLTYDLRTAVAGFSRLLGREVDSSDQLQAVEEMLDSVFAQFCIGK